MKNIITYHFTKTFFWIRIFKHGIAVKNLKHHMLLFSERNGYTKNIIIGNWCILYLKPIT